MLTSRQCHVYLTWVMSGRVGGVYSQTPDGHGEAMSETFEAIPHLDERTNHESLEESKDVGSRGTMLSYPIVLGDNHAGRGVEEMRLTREVGTYLWREASLGLEEWTADRVGMEMAIDGRMKRILGRTAISPRVDVDHAIGLTVLGEKVMGIAS